MVANGFPVPILFLIYHRLDTTRQVFERIRAMQPKKLYVAADGPKADDPTEAADFGCEGSDYQDRAKWIWKTRPNLDWRVRQLGKAPSVVTARGPVELVQIKTVGVMIPAFPRCHT